VKAFYWSALINGMTLAPVLVLLVLLGATRAAVGDLHAHWMTRALCWLAAIVTGGALAVHVLLEFI
jgi:Mn2+/Fe2+ NRAMP family transporter